MHELTPTFTITNRITAAISQIERPHGLPEPPRLVLDMGRKALSYEKRNES